MKDTFRFGKRVPLPSTVQILHDLRAMNRADDEKLRAAKAPQPVDHPIAVTPSDTPA